jgi:hypothetical protein
MIIMLKSSHIERPVKEGRSLENRMQFNRRAGSRGEKCHDLHKTRAAAFQLLVVHHYPYDETR